MAPRRPDPGAAHIRRTLTGLLSLLGKRSRLSNDELEELLARVAAKVNGLPRDPAVLGVLDEVVGESAARRRDAAILLVGLSDVAGAERRLLALAGARDAESRLAFVQAVWKQRWLPQAPLLARRITVEKDRSCRGALLAALGDIRTPETLDALLALADRDREDRTDERKALLFALRKHQSRKAKRYFQAVFREPPPVPLPRFSSHKEERVLAAWGLLKLGPSVRAHAYLVDMLDDPRVELAWEGGRGVDPGVSERAAQALADVHGLPFEWGAGFVPRIKRAIRGIVHDR